MPLSPMAKPGDNLEQSMCRERTEEEQRAVEQTHLLRALLHAGGVEVRPIPKISTKPPFEID